MKGCTHQEFFAGMAASDVDSSVEQKIREAAAVVVNNVIFKAKEMAQQKAAPQKSFSVVAEEDEDAMLAEEAARRRAQSDRSPSFTGVPPEIQIDFVEDRPPTPEEVPTYVAPPVKKRQVKIRHRTTEPRDGHNGDHNAGDVDGDDDLSIVSASVSASSSVRPQSPVSSPEDTSAAPGSAASDHNDKWAAPAPAAAAEAATAVAPPASDSNSWSTPPSPAAPPSPSTSCMANHVGGYAVKFNAAVVQHSVNETRAAPVASHAPPPPPSPPAAVATPSIPAAGDGRRPPRSAKEYLCSKPASLPYADDDEVDDNDNAGSDEAAAKGQSKEAARTVSAAVGQGYSSAKSGKDLANDPEFRRFVEEYIKGIMEQAYIIAEEQMRKTSTEVKHQPPPASTSLQPTATMIVHDEPVAGSWYTRARELFSQCLQSACICFASSERQPEAV